MLKKRVLLTLIVAFTVVKVAEPSVATSGEQERIAVSLVSLLATPERFEGKFVHVVGYLTSGPALHLYLSKEHAKIFDLPSSIFINDTSPGGTLTQSSCEGRFVRVRGVFGRYEGVQPAIVEVAQVDDLETHETCWKSGGSGS